MEISDYITTLKNTKTCIAGLISFQEYSFKSKAFGLYRTLPNIPHADDDRHVVVMKIRGNQPNIFSVLKDPEHSINLTSKDADKLLFIFIEMRPQILKVETPTEGYHLGDGHRISGALTITYQVVDAESFWKGGRDQLAEFETTIIDATKNFFLNITSNYLISSPAELKQSLEQHIRETGIKTVKCNLEDSIWKNCEIAGIKLIKVYADVYLSDSLREHLQRMHNRLYGEGGAAERWKIDQLINSDKTFYPFELRKVIMTLDMRLLENFYTMKWSDAMRKVTEKLAGKKEEYQKSLEDMEITRMRKIIDTAEEVQLDEMDLKDLKTKLADKLMKMADSASSEQLPTDTQYLEHVIGSTSSAGQITASNDTQQKSLESDQGKDK